MSWAIEEKDIPDNVAIHKFIFENTDFLKHVSSFSSHSFLLYQQVKYKGDIEKLRESIEMGLSMYGLFPFKYKNGRMNDAYLSSSLTYNSLAIDKISDNVHQATLGSSLIGAGSYSTNSELFQRNTYNDTLAFKEKTPLAKFGEIKEILDSVKVQISRSRISKVVSRKVDLSDFNFGWHNDESIFLNLRINIPIISSSDHYIQIIPKGVQDNEHLEMSEFNLKSGFVYVYNTELNHRPYLKQKSDIDRINFILGVSPWISFDSKERVWYSNEYYGRIHPFEMFKEGLISSYF